MRVNTRLFGEIEFDISDEEILYYSYTDISKALKIYKREWKQKYNDIN